MAGGGVARYSEVSVPGGGVQVDDASPCKRKGTTHGSHSCCSTAGAGRGPVLPLLCRFCCCCSTAGAGRGPVLPLLLLLLQGMVCAVLTGWMVQGLCVCVQRGGYGINNAPGRAQHCADQVAAMSMACPVYTTPSASSSASSCEPPAPPPPTPTCSPGNGVHNTKHRQQRCTKEATHKQHVADPGRSTHAAVPAT